VSDALRSWLRRQEQPVKLKLDGANVIDVPQGRGRWRELLTTLDAYKPKVIEALRADDSRIRARACEPDDFDVEGDDDEEKPSGPPTRDLDLDVSTPNGALCYALVELVQANIQLCETVRSCATDALDRTEAAARTAELHARADLERARREGAAGAAGDGEPAQQSDLQAIMGAFGAAAQAKKQGSPNGQG
jgi:hypothetical protein